MAMRPRTYTALCAVMLGLAFVDAFVGTPRAAPRATSTALFYAAPPPSPRARSALFSTIEHKFKVPVNTA